MSPSDKIPADAHGRLGLSPPSHSVTTEPFRITTSFRVLRIICHEMYPVLGLPLSVLTIQSQLRRAILAQLVTHRIISLFDYKIPNLSFFLSSYQNRLKHSPGSTILLLLNSLVSFWTVFSFGALGNRVRSHFSLVSNDQSFCDIYYIRFDRSRRLAPRLSKNLHQAPKMIFIKIHHIFFLKYFFLLWHQ